MRALIGLAAVVLLAGCGQGSLLTSDVIIDVDQTSFQPDSTSFETYPFNLNGHWRLQYGWDCTRQAEEGKVGLDRFTMNLINTDDMSLAAEHPVTHGKGRRGSGQFEVSRQGLYELHVDTVCDWHARALQLSGRG